MGSGCWSASVGVCYNLTGSSTCGLRPAGVQEEVLVVVVGGSANQGTWYTVPGGTWYAVPDDTCMVPCDTWYAAQVVPVRYQVLHGMRYHVVPARYQVIHGIRYHVVPARYQVVHGMLYQVVYDMRYQVVHDMRYQVVHTRYEVVRGMRYQVVPAWYHMVHVRVHGTWYQGCRCGTRVYLLAAALQDVLFYLLGKGAGRLEAPLPVCLLADEAALMAADGTIWHPHQVIHPSPRACAVPSRDFCWCQAAF